jgi:hypothetical protein
MDVLDALELRRQLGNVGDILKHAALVELAAWLARERADVSFVDTHTFQLQAPLPDRARWEREVDALAARHPAYERYATLERSSLGRNGHYRRSSALVLDALGDRRACAILGEANAASRAELSAQIAADRFENVLVVEDAARVDDVARVPGGGTLLVHVDPFRLSSELWSRDSASAVGDVRSLHGRRVRSLSLLPERARCLARSRCRRITARREAKARADHAGGCAHVRELCVFLPRKWARLRDK